MICPHCGHEEHFYTKAQYRGSGPVYYDSNGNYDEDSGININMYDNLSTKEGDIYYCSQCDKRVARK